MHLPLVSVRAGNAGRTEPLQSIGVYLPVRMSADPPTPRNPDFDAKVRALFTRAVFVTHLGVRTLEVSPGRCVTTLDVRPEHAQQNGYVHAGVLATAADH